MITLWNIFKIELADMQKNGSHQQKDSDQIITNSIYKYF